MLATRIIALLAFLFVFIICFSLKQTMGETDYADETSNVYSNPTDEEINSISNENSDIYLNQDASGSEENDDIPLLLTKYIEKGNIKSARGLSRVGDLPNAPSIESYSGFITVKKEYNSNIFFWFFPAVNKNESAPVILWLQGGPGLSGLLGLFVEHGPYIIQENLTATLRKYHWAQTFHMIYVDNPVGTGFSFTDKRRGYAKSQDQMAEDMYEFLRQFFILFSEYKRNDFYIAGQSYAGKWVPSLANKIHTTGPNAAVQLKGIMIGNGFCDPESVMESYSEFMYNIGHIDKKQAKRIQSYSDSIVQYIKEEDYLEAHDGMRMLLRDYRRFSGMMSIYNFLILELPPDHFYYLRYINHPQFKKALNVGNVTHKWGDYVHHSLSHDFMRSVKSNVSVIMDHYKVLVYHGQLDVIVPYPSVSNFLRTVDWKYAEEFKAAERKIWYLKNSTEIAGYVHNVGDFYEVMVRNAGHEVPYDKPEVAFDLISRFVNHEPYHG